MTATAIGVIGLVSLVIFILLRVPVAVALGLVGYFGYAALDGFGRANLMISGVPVEFGSTYTLSVVPLFTLMGAVAASAGLSSDLFNAGRVLFRGARGSLAIASIFASALFGAVCGSSVATALTMSRFRFRKCCAPSIRPPWRPARWRPVARSGFSFRRR